MNLESSSYLEESGERRAWQRNLILINLLKNTIELSLSFVVDVVVVVAVLSVVKWRHRLVFRS